MNNCRSLPSPICCYCYCSASNVFSFVSLDVNTGWMNPRLSRVKTMKAWDQFAVRVCHGFLLRFPPSVSEKTHPMIFGDCFGKHDSSKPEETLNHSRSWVHKVWARNVRLAGTPTCQKENKQKTRNMLIIDFQFLLGVLKSQPMLQHVFV